MDATYRAEQLEKARKEADAARLRFNSTTDRKARRQASEDHEFWSNKAAFLANAK